MAQAANRVKARVRHLVDRLPAPRNEAALSLLRSARDLAKGEAPAEDKAPAKPASSTRAAAQRPSEQLLRQVLASKGQHPDPPVDPEGNDPSERAAARAGWLLVDAYERLTKTAADRVFGHELAAWFDYAKSTIPDLEPWGKPGSLKGYETDNNRLRFRRTMDFVRPGERVFDVGYGHGYLAGVLLRDRKLSAYHGIDILRSNFDACNEMLRVNGFTDADVGLSTGDIYDLTREQVEATGAEMIICCEVLEHVPDAELALRKLADALPEGGDLLFSVPLHGRIESVWGHVSVFDVARLKAMVHGAGLYAHHVEPLANTWAIVVASRSPEPSQRVREATTRPPTNVSTPLTSHRAFVDMEAERFSVERVSEGTTCELSKRQSYQTWCAIATKGGDTDRGKATVSFPVDGLSSMRLFFEFADFTPVRGVQVHARAGDKRVAEWRWQPRKGEKARVPKVALRPGESTRAFRAGEFSPDVAMATRVDVTFDVSSGSSTEIGLRAAYLPAS